MKPPAFQFYADDFVAGVADLSTKEIGAYILLLCHQWSRGGLPNDEQRLFRMARTNNEADNEAAVRYVVANKFEVCADGLLRNKRMEQVRKDSEEFRLRSSNGGKASAAKRVGDSSWGKKMAKKRKSSNEATTKRDAKSPSPSPSPVLNTFGIKLSTPRILEIWEKWMNHRRSLKKPKCWSTLFNEQIKFLEGFTEDQAFQVLQTSVMNGYQGLFPPKHSNQNGNGGDSFWKTTKELELVETELKKINERASQTAMGRTIEDKDKESYDRLKKRRSELKSQLQLR